MVMEYEQHLKKVNEEINNVSPSFCVAKWKQVTMHLQNGHNHSCHHPSTHFVSVDEIKRNPTALHNSEYKKEQRRKMLEGARPSECDYCWRVEDTPGNHYSDRTYKSADDSWARPYINEIAKTPWTHDVDPSYVEVSFGNVCNFKCSYCAPHISSQWMEEIERYGAYPTSNKFNNLKWIHAQNLMPIPNNQENPYVDAFWNWFPEMYKSLKYFRITGGEPLLNKNTFKVLDYIIENPNSDLEVAINTNMNPPKELFEKFLEKVKIIVDEKKLKRFKLFTSAEAHGKQSEYIRFGMNYDNWLENIHKTYQAIPEIQFTIMSTYNILSLTSYTKFLQDILGIKQKYGTSNYSPILLDIPYLRYPEHQTIFMMEKEHLKMIDDQITFMAQNIEYKDWHSTTNKGFFESEIDKLKRIYTIAKDSIENPNEWVDHNRKDFAIFVDEHDRRRGTNFLKTFPELESFYTKCKSIN
jgi:organic radical activating enzyme